MEYTKHLESKQNNMEVISRDYELSMIFQKDTNSQTRKNLTVATEWLVVFLRWKVIVDGIC